MLMFRRSKDILKKRERENNFKKYFNPLNMPANLNTLKGVEKRKHKKKVVSQVKQPKKKRCKKV